ncbi:hypothetical protein M2418_005200 [Rhizobium sp. BIGb0125]|jgi:hypothetical protein|nr:hypothetical protein [Rhizobium sp. BIGb0125]
MCDPFTNDMTWSEIHARYSILDKGPPTLQHAATLQNNGHPKRSFHPQARRMARH